MWIKLERAVGRKLAKVAVRRLIHVFVARYKGQPLRNTGLLSIGAAVGLTAGWIAGRKTAQRAVNRPDGPEAAPAHAPSEDPARSAASLRG
jgi:hypothetical protein